LGAAAQASEREITFKGVGGLELKGTLAVPDSAAPGKTKALLLLPGSGPSDRNGNQPGLQIDILRQIAVRLEKEGVATLRFDKRGTLGYAKSFPKDLDALGEFFSFETFIGDAEAALAFLQSQPEVDPDKTGVLGHSEGATIALEMTKGANPPPFIALMGCPGRLLGDVLINQFDAGMIREGMAENEREPLIKGLRDSIAELKTTGKLPNTVPDRFKMYLPTYLSKYFHSLFFFDPVAAAAAYGRPVLHLQGEKDIQILAAKDAPPLRKAFGANSHYEYHEFPSLSHCFKFVKDENKEAGFEGPVPTEVLDSIAVWMGSR
jgi:dienelactone hydrolase